MTVEKKAEYRGIMKGTAIFGGVQIFQLLVNILRGKFIALFLGPAGMGVSALLTSTVNTISQMSSLGLSMGAMRDISVAYKDGDIESLSIVVKVFRRLVIFTGILGALICVIGAKWWSEIAFGSSDYIFSFVILGAMLFFTALASGETALLQGTRHLKSLAKTSFLGALVGLLCGIPMYYFWGIDGIAPAMVLLAVVTYSSNKFFSRKIRINKVKVTTQQAQVHAKAMISLGVTLTFAALLGTLSVYFINWFIRYNGSLTDVGLYQAASSITTQYVGFIFSAMAVDYFPRLAAISKDNRAVCKVVNQQSEIVVLVTTPIILLLLTTAPLVVQVLLSKDFFEVIPVLRWMGVALFFKAASYALGYVSFAKGDKHTFFWLEGVVGNLLNIVCSVIGYYLWGLVGLGISMCMAFLIYLLLISAVIRIKYHIELDREYIKIGLFLLLCIISSFLLSFIVTDDFWYSILSGLICVGIGYYCYAELDKRIQIKELIKSKIGKK